MDGIHQKQEIKHEIYIERWKKLIFSLKKIEEGHFIVIRPTVEGRIKVQAS